MSIQIERVYDSIRQQERAALERRTAEAYARCPELAVLPARRQAVLRDAAARRIGADEASALLSSIAQSEASLLEGSGLAADTLALQYQCPRCQDTGWTGEAERRPCACRLKLAALLDAGIGINDRETFERFSTGIYPTEEQKKRTLAAKAWCEAYADALPKLEKPNVLLTGMAGLGKSYLCNAIAYRALCRGIDARRVTAYGFVQDALDGIREHRGGNLLFHRVPLLVIDDLGSEPLIPNVSEEALFSVLNERLNARRATVVATNLSLPGLQERYGERVMSRLTDRGATQPILLTGDNLRWSGAPC